MDSASRCAPGMTVETVTPTPRKPRTPPAPARYARASRRRRRSCRRAGSRPRRGRARHAISRAARRCGTGRGGTAARACASRARARRDRRCARRHRSRCESLVDLVKALRIAGIAQDPQLLVQRLQRARSAAVMRSAAMPAHSASSSAIASNMPASRSSVGRATTAPRCARASTRPLAASCRSASRTGVRDTLKRRARSVSSSARARRELAADDLVGKQQPQFFRAGDLGRCGEARSTRRPAARHRRAGLRTPLESSSRLMPSNPCLRFGLVDHADVGGDDAPAFGKADPGLHLPPDLAGPRRRDRTVSRRWRSRGRRW